MEKNNKEASQTLAMAYENHKKGNLKLAESLYKKVLKLNSKNFEATFLLGSLSIQKKNYDQAIRFLNKSIEINPRHANSYQNLGFVWLAMNDYEKATQFLNKAIEIEPNHVDANFNLGNAYKQYRFFKKAQAQYEKTIKLQPNNPSAYNNLANTHKAQGNFSEAINCYLKAIKLQPNHARAYHNLGNTYNQLGDYSRAITAFKKSFERQPSNLESLYNISDLEERILNPEIKIKIKEIMKMGTLSKKDKAYGNFLYAKYELMNENFEKEFNYLIDGHKDYFSSKANYFEQGVIYWLKNLPNKKELDHMKELKNSSNIRPIFIVGVPRCGSTVIEKVIASGTKRFPIGEECSVISNIVGEKVLANNLLNTDTENLKNQIIKKYESLSLSKKESNYIFTDKTLDNFFFIDIINKIFPSAKIINCKRSPIASIMSILKNNLGDVSWAHSLEHIFKYFDIYYNKISFFKKKYPDFIYDLEFENFQNNPENESKKLMEFCNLPWSKSCLEYYKRKDIVSYTASHRQIRQAIYKDSGERHKPYIPLLNKYGKKYNWFLNT